MKIVYAAFSTVWLSGCGTYAPQHPEFWAADLSLSQKTANIAAQVKCELARGVQNLNRGGATWINGWGALVSFTLDTSEKTTLMPGVSLLKPLPNAVSHFPGLDDVTTGQSFKFGLGAELSSEAQRKSAVTFFYTVAELAAFAYREPCLPAASARGFLFMESALGLDQWLYAAASLATTNTAAEPFLKTGPYAQNAISETIKFEIVTGGTATPVWKLVRVAANEDGPLFGARKQRSQQVDITLGPLDKAPGGALGPAAQAQFNAQLIAAALRRRTGD